MIAAIHSSRRMVRRARVYSPGIRRTKITETAEYSKKKIFKADVERNRKDGRDEIIKMYIFLRISISVSLAKNKIMEKLYKI